MKRLLCLLTALCLPLTALAEDTPDHVTEQLFSNSLATTITIDADVIVPETASIPRYQARLREFTESEVHAMADALFGNHAYTGSGGYEDIYDNNGRLGWHQMTFQTVESVDTRRGADSPLYTLSVSTSYDMDAVTPGYVYAQFEQAQIAGGDCFYGTMPNAIETIPEGGPIGCTLSRDDALALADAAIASFAPHLTLAAEGVMWADTVPGDLDVNFTSDYIPHHQGWAFVYTRSLPLPLSYETTSPTNDYSTRIPDEFLRIVVDDGGIQGMRYEQPFEIIGTLDEHCELLPFDKIMDVARTILPLRYTYSENAYSDIRLLIDRITLGYAVTRSRSNAGGYEVIPVWDFFGTAEMRQEKGGEVIVAWEDPFQSLLTISALDGIVIDRTYGY